MKTLILTLLVCVQACGAGFFAAQQAVIGGSETPAEFNPSDYGTVLAWFSLRKETGFSDGDSIGTLTDFSSQGKDLSQGTTAAKPLFKTSIVNGHPAMLMDGVDDFLLASSSVGTDYKTVFVVAYYSGATFANYGGLLSSGVANENQVPLQGNVGTTYFYNALKTTTYWKDGVSYPETGMTGPMNAWAVMRHQASSGWQAATTIQIGKDRTFAGRFWSGYVTEVIYYQEELSTEDCEAVEDALGGLFNITITH
jgi:hypothetical protein